MGAKEELAELRRLDELEAKAAKSKKPKEAPADPTADMSMFDKIRSGVGSGMIQGARGATNLLVKALNAGPQGIAARLTKTPLPYETPEFATDEAIKEQKRVDAPLEKTSPGFWGGLGGQVAATLPLSLATGGAGAASTATNVLGRVAASPVTRAAVEGAVDSAIYADPEEKKGAAAGGAALGGALNVLGSGAGRLIKGLVKKSQAAEDLAHIAGQHGEDIDIPLSQVASDDDMFSRIMKSFYKEAMPIVPGASTRLQGQTKSALEKTRRLALQEAVPEGSSLSKGAEKDTALAVGALKNSFDAAYKKVKDIDFPAPTDFHARVVAKIKAANPTVDQVTLDKVASQADELFQRFSSGARPASAVPGSGGRPMSAAGQITGDNLLNLKNELGDLVGQSKGFEKNSMIAAQSAVDDIMRPSLKIQGLEKEYDDLTEPYRHFLGVSKAAKSAKTKKGNFSMTQLARAAKDPSQAHLATTAAEVLEQPVVGSSIAGKILAGGAMAGTGVGAFMAPLLTGALVGGGHVLTNPSTQRALLGDTAAQKALIKALRANPELARRLGSSMRAGATTEFGEDYGSP